MIRKHMDYYTKLIQTEIEPLRNKQILVVYKLEYDTKSRRRCVQNHKLEYDTKRRKRTQTKKGPPRKRVPLEKGSPSKKGPPRKRVPLHHLQNLLKSILCQ